MFLVGAVIDGVDELAVGLSGRQSPPREEGWTRHQENAAKPPLLERTGWSLTETVSVDDHPVCAASEASRLFLTGAATPPHEEGTALTETFGQFMSQFA